MLRDELLPVRGHVIGGEDADELEFPSQVSLQVARPELNPPFRLVCGANVLNEHWALTAAHCVEKRLHEVEKLSVVSGSVLLSRGGMRHQLSAVIVHPGYDPTNYWRHDIALLKVVQPFRLDGGTVEAAQLPRQGQRVPPHVAATVVGWGLTQEDGTVPSDRLQKAVLRITPITECKAQYDTIGARVHETNLCAGLDDGSAGPCKGDSGGPLFVDGVLVGLTSWGAGCSRRFPAVFTRVSSYVDWIHQHIE